MRDLSEILEEIEDKMLERDVVIVVTNLTKERSDYLFGTLTKYDVKKETVISGEDKVVTYSLEISHRGRQ